MYRVYGNTGKGAGNTPGVRLERTVRVLRADKMPKVFQPQEEPGKDSANVIDYPHK